MFLSSLTFSEISEEEAEQLMSDEGINTEDSGRGQRKSAMEKLMEAEEVVDRKEYEMAVGRFGGISFSETTGEEYDETSEEYGSEEEYESEEGYDEDSEYDEDESDIEFEDDENEDEFELPDDEFFFDDDEDSEYEPAPFVFADLLDSMAEEHADMNLDERMEELGEPVMEITLEELAAYVKEKRKK